MSQPLDQKNYLLGLAADAGNLVDTALARSTRHRYLASWQRYQDWCSKHDLNANLSSAQSVGLFLTERSRTVGAAALTQDLSAIRYHLKRVGNALRDDRDLLPRLLRGCRRTKNHAIRRKKKIEPEALLASLSFLPDSRKGLRDRAMLLTTFASAMRRSEVVQLTWNNIRFEQNGFWITTGWSKSGHAIDGCFVPKVGTSLCAWSVMIAWFEQLSRTSSFCFPRIRSGHSLEAHVSDRYLYRLVRRLMGQTGACAEEYGAHSLRRGFIAAAHKSGACNADILNVTHHRTERGLFPYIGGESGIAYSRIVRSMTAGDNEHERS